MDNEHLRKLLVSIQAEVGDEIIECNNPWQAIGLMQAFSILHRAIEQNCPDLLSVKSELKNIDYGKQLDILSNLNKGQ